ncbi:hypothetical protein [Halalkalibacter krulwichiae]|uniref:Uncharacterized protein n=1 Tax=Halalkalibacter krulwichiae TaxID=199441 RepID=A0A1X9MH37_9BACI|nr:hypothetical protein [Halalkalibacter krulwichiae]ARK31443.1 hypothetical protein BkAM31D_17245 [Halalkalibacter krulwichiae]
MTKRAVPLLYIHQPKEIDVEAKSQEFVYQKFKVNVKRKIVSDIEEDSVEMGIDDSSIEEK